MLIWGEIDAVASLYCVVPLESSAMCNKKAVRRTAPFIIRVTICEQATIVTLTTKATLASGSLVAHCARDSGGGGGVACLPQCLKALCDFRGIHLHHTHVINYRLLLRVGLHG